MPWTGWKLWGACTSVRLDRIMRSRVESALSGVIDPEIGLSIVDLGLLFEVRLEEETLRVTIGTTSPACPMVGVIRDDAERAIRAAFSEIETVLVEVDPS